MIKVRVIAFAATLCAPILALANNPSIAEKVCIFEAAKRLPAIPSLQIVASSTRPVPPDVLGKSQFQDMPGVTTMVVSLEVKAAAQTATFDFICGSNSVGTVAESIGITK